MTPGGGRGEEKERREEERVETMKLGREEEVRNEEEEKMRRFMSLNMAPRERASLHRQTQ